MKTYAEIYKLRNLIKGLTCFKNQENPACIDLILINKPFSFINTYAVQTGLSDFHKMIVAFDENAFCWVIGNIRTFITKLS